MWNRKRCLLLLRLHELTADFGLLNTFSIVTKSLKDGIAEYIGADGSEKEPDMVSKRSRWHSMRKERLWSRAEAA
jgi:hypothetical protein